jgi:hypothetical protein
MYKVTIKAKVKHENPSFGEIKSKGAEAAKEKFREAISQLKGLSDVEVIIEELKDNEIQDV